MKDGQWTWNKYEDEIWRHEGYDTKEQAIQAGKEAAQEEGYDHFYIGQEKSVELPTIGADDVLEQLSERVYDDVGEVAEEYLANVSKEDEDALEEALNQVFQKWAEERGYKPDFYTLENIERINCGPKEPPSGPGVCRICGCTDLHG